jgi:hypothetical protein
VKIFALILTLDAITACRAGPALPPPPTTPPVQDHLVVPGKRVGAISIGMTQDQLFAALGLPVDSYQYPSSVGHAYERHKNDDQSFYDGLVVSVRNGSSQVQSVKVGKFNSGYATAEGLTVGTTERKVRELMGPPTQVRLKTEHTYDTYCYPGLVVAFHEGEVIFVSIPGC